eukprot:CAMPEP_0170592852 /NCGR_PEP_ID=MMETSP0224-20130122/13139_1 /TAXON_ID=285029 /ORGANISM="Togula jolla, Strain CCCM 725" /LENGTH=584 /DNA_ID=CAMNT_0010916773 /DNA_START=803 /DNA_END=2555 /DNA_ORIENTATION=-
MKPIIVAVVLMGITFAQAGGRRALRAHPGAPADADREELFRLAMAEAMGCGGVEPERFAAIERVLAPIWRVLPKNRNDRVDWRMLRFVAHRYFMQTSSLLIRGFEPSRRVNESSPGIAEMMRAKVPSMAEAMLEGKLAAKGFCFQDAVAMVAALEQLIIDSESAVLEKVFARRGLPLDGQLGQAELAQVMEEYMIHWFMGGNQASVRILTANRTLLEEVFLHWPEIRHFATGMATKIHFARQTKPLPGQGLPLMTQSFSFEDAHQAVGGITRTFASYWESECQATKAALVAMDRDRTGRVSLPDFYGSNLEGQWRFGESEAYLRDLGALDETSAWRGKRVIIPNYMQGSSNCMVTTANYLICCVSECEPILNEIEASIGAPLGLPKEILQLVTGMTDFEDEPPSVSAALKGQLQRIAESHGGKVPLHGRLFAQWLHHVFPHECPLPHKLGSQPAQTPAEYGQSYMASEAEVHGHAAARNVSAQEALDVQEEQHLLQWSEDEELFAENSWHFRAWDALQASSSSALLLSSSSFCLDSRSRKTPGGAFPSAASRARLTSSESNSSGAGCWCRDAGKTRYQQHAHPS